VITFCAKILALCFFKLPGVAFGLLHALPASRSYISRMAKAMDLIGYVSPLCEQCQGDIMWGSLGFGSLGSFCLTICTHSRLFGMIYHI
jgi:hypothetical protein